MSYKLFYDLETTGLIDKRFPFSHPDQAKIVQIGAILDDAEGNEISRLDVIIAQKNPIPEGAMKAHGISMEHSQRVGVREDIAIELLLDLIDVADVVVGYNHKFFDNSFVIGGARRILQNESFDPFAGKNLFDVMHAGKPIMKLRAANGGYRNPKLIDLYTHFFRQPFANAHQAIADVKATRECFYKMQAMVAPETAAAE